VGAAGAVGADQHRQPRSPTWTGGRQLPQSCLGDLYVIDGRVRARITLSEQHRDGLDDATGTMVGPRSDRVMAKSTPESGCC